MSQQQTIRDGTSVRTESPQQHDILLVANMDKKSLRVASDKAGKTDRFDKLIKEENPPFLNIDKSNILENFVSNYLRQSKDPTHFRFFRVPLPDAKDAAPNMRELFRDNPSREMQDFVQKYEVKPVSQVSEQINNHQTLNEQKMNPNQETKTQTAPAENASKTRFNEAMINWEQLKDFGISREYLEKSKLLDDMLKGYKTNKLVPITANFGSATLRTDARLSFQQSPSGEVVLAMHGMRKSPELEKPYYGHVFSEEDKANLKERGNMGRQAMLSFRSSGEKVPCLISIDKLTSEIVPVRADKVYIPDEVCGVKLTDHEKNELREGRAISVDDMVSKNGKEFSADLQINADKRGIEFIFPNDGVFNKESIGGVDLTKKQIEDLQTGKAIFVEDMKTKTGDTFSSFVKLDGNGNPSYTRYNPDSPEGAREIYIPKELNTTRLTSEDRDALRAGQPVFIENMVNKKGEEFSSFVKIDTETGNISYSKMPDGFNEKPAFKIPAEVWGHTLNTTERAALQDGKAIYVDDMTGFKGQKFSSWVKVNENQGKLDYYSENPDKPRQNTGQAENATAVTARQENKESEEKTVKKKEAQPQKTSTKRKL